jgi:hypothetical protein
MKKVFIEIGAVVLFCLLYFLFPGFRTTIVSAFCILAVWVIPVQLLLSINYQNWLNELSGRYDHLDYNERMEQIRATFNNLKDAEIKKLRWFYIHVHLFYYAFFLVYSLTIAAIAGLFVYLGIYKSEPLNVALYLMVAIIIVFGGYITEKSIFSLKVRKDRDEIFNLFWSNDWKKKLYRVPDAKDDYAQASSFYSFWLQGKNITEKEAAFKKLIADLNQYSKNGPLFIFNDQGKIEIVAVIDVRGINKTLAGFLKYCIEDRKILSDGILHHSHRELLRNVFLLDNVKSLTFLEGQRYRSTHTDYQDIYRSSLKV